MKKLVLILLISYPALAAGLEVFPQKVGLFTVKGAQPVDAVIRDAILAKAPSLSNIYLLSGSPDELEMLGVKELNASVFLGTATAKGVTVLRLYQVTGTATNQLLSNIQWKAGTLAQALPQVTGSAVQAIVSAFPPLEKKDLKVEQAVRKISEFERDVPTISVGLVPLMYTTRKADINIYVGNSSTGKQNLYNLTPLAIGTQKATVALDWMALHTALSLTLNPFDFSGFETELEASYGLFGSFIIAGFGLGYNLIQFNGSKTAPLFYTDESLTTNQAVYLPDITCHLFSINPVLRFNLTSSFQFRLRMVISLVSQSSFEFNRDFYYRHDGDQIIMPEFAGGDMSFALQIARGHTVILGFGGFGATIYDNTDPEPKVIGTVNGQNIRMYDIYFGALTYFAGYQYEF